MRTFFRRARQWRALQGPEREVFFAQEHKPGQLLQLDWTYGSESKVTIEDSTLDYLFYRWVLPYFGLRVGYGGAFRNRF